MGFSMKDRPMKNQISNNSFSEKAKDAAKATGRGIGHVVGAVKDASVPVTSEAKRGVKNLGTAVKGMTRFHNSDLKHKMTHGHSRAIDKD